MCGSLRFRKEELPKTQGERRVICAAKGNGLFSVGKPVFGGKTCFQWEKPVCGGKTCMVFLKGDNPFLGQRVAGAAVIFRRKTPTEESFALLGSTCANEPYKHSLI